MRAIPNLLEEAEVLNPDRSVLWGQVWGAEVLGRAIGHELRYWLETEKASTAMLTYYDIIDPSLPPRLVSHHIADVLL